MAITYRREQRPEYDVLRDRVVFFNSTTECFIEWNALLVVEQAKSAAYERLIIAGGGKAITKSGKLTRTKVRVATGDT